MPMTRTYNTDATKITDQIKTSISQGLAQVLGTGHVIRITAVDFTRDNLEPVGQQFIIKITADVYPQDKTPS